MMVSKARRTYSRFEPIVTVTTRPDRRELTHDRLFAQSAVITADSTGESGVAGRGYWPIKTSETKAWSLQGRRNFELDFTEHSLLNHASVMFLESL